MPKNGKKYLRKADGADGSLRVVRVDDGFVQGEDCHVIVRRIFIFHLKLVVNEDLSDLANVV